MATRSLCTARSSTIRRQEERDSEIYKPPSLLPLQRLQSMSIMEEVEMGHRNPYSIVVSNLAKHSHAQSELFAATCQSTEILGVKFVLWKHHKWSTKRCLFAYASGSFIGFT
jgi:hypothetical protein